jgi:membrane protease YdiL (CAAX protease family)
VKKKITHIIKSLMPVSAALLIQSGLMAAAISAYGLITGNAKMPDILEYNLTVAVVLISGIAFAIWYLKLTEGSLREGIPIKPAKALLNLILLIPLGIGCQLFASGIIGLIRNIFVRTFNDYGNVMISYYIGNPAVVVIYITILAPVAEELIFRGVTMKKALKGLTFTEANLMQAVLFGIYHRTPVQCIYAFLSALLFGYILKGYGTLAAPVILHMVINASSFLVKLLPSGSLSAAAAAISGGAITALCILYIKKVVGYNNK